VKKPTFSAFAQFYPASPWNYLGIMEKRNQALCHVETSARRNARNRRKMKYSKLPSDKICDNAAT